MKTLGTIFAITLAILPWCATPLFGQQATQDSGKKITITKRSTQQDGTELVETEIKKGSAAENFNVDRYIRENRSDKVQIEVKVQQGQDANIQSLNDQWAQKITTHSNISTCQNEPSAFLGVEPDEDESPQTPGLIVQIVRGGAAEAAGLRTNDVILSLNNTPINEWADLSAFIRKAKPGDKVRIQYERNGEKLNTEATLITKNDVKASAEAPKKGFLGVSPGPDNQADQEGIIVNITPKSAAEKAGMISGDQLLKIDKTPIHDFEDVSDVMENTRPGDQLSILFERNGQRKTVKAILGEQKTWDYNNWNAGNIDLGRLNMKVKQKEACLGVYTSTLVTENDEAGPQSGTLISEFMDESAAKDAKMQKGDVITSINRMPVKNEDELWNEIAKYHSGDQVIVEFLRNGQWMKVTAQLKACSDNSNQITMDETDDEGDNQSRTFYTWNWDQEDQTRMRERRVITIRKGDGDGSRINTTPAQLPAQSKSLTLRNFKAAQDSTPGQVALEFSSTAEPTIVTLYDQDGRQLFREELNAFGGEYQQVFDLSAYAKNNILIHVQQNDQVYTEQIKVL
jgi:S1-C subfamily serine protease